MSNKAAYSAVLMLAIALLFSGAFLYPQSPSKSLASKPSPEPSGWIDAEVLGMIATAPAIPADKPNHRLTYKGTYTFMGKSSDVELTVPSLGGEVNGKILGTCNGNIKAINVQGKIKGAGVGKCKILLADLDSSASFDGLLKDGKIDLSFKGKAGEIPHEGNMVLTR